MPTRQKNRNLLSIMILLALSLGSILIGSEAVSAGKCKTIAEYCQNMYDSFQNCFDHIKIPEGGEILPIGAQIQIICTTSIIACNAEISGRSVLSCFSSAPPSVIPSSKFQLVTTPNDVCRAFNIGSSQKVGIYYRWCPTSQNWRA